MQLIAILFYIVLGAASCQEQPRTEYVTDKPGLLSGSQKNSINDTLKALHNQFNSEFLLFIDTTYTGSTSDVATEVFNQLGIGPNGLNDGVLLYINTTTQRVELRIGYGLEWSLPQGQLDSTVSMCVQDFRKSRYFTGILNSVVYLREKLKKVSWNYCASVARNNCIETINVELVTLRTPDSLVIVSDNRQRFIIRLTKTMDELSSAIRKSTVIYCRTTPWTDTKLLLGVK